jgi:hypothetical protein
MLTPRYLRRLLVRRLPIDFRVAVADVAVYLAVLGAGDGH